MLDARPRALHGVDRGQPVEPLPQIGIFDGRHPPVPLPLPVVLAPLRQTRFQPRLQIPAPRHQRHSRRLVERLQSADHRQQLQPFAAGLVLLVGGFEGRFAGRAAEDESPPRGGRIVRIGSQSGFRIEQEVRGGNCHRWRVALGGQGLTLRPVRIRSAYSRFLHPGASRRSEHMADLPPWDCYRQLFASLSSLSHS